MQSQPKTRFVSVSLPIRGKQETDGNQSGNGQETKSAYLCRNGNGAIHTGGNEGPQFQTVVSSLLRQKSFRPSQKDQQRSVYRALPI